MVNTFLPDESFKTSLASLDNRRLGKQRVETKQILRALRGETTGWRNHPAARMWNGCEGTLARYGIYACKIWIDRGFEDNLLAYFEEMENDYPVFHTPWWIGLDTFHISHRSNLIRKDPGRYGLFWPGVPPDLPYYWPM